MSLRSRITGLLTSGAATAAVFSLRFARSVFVTMLERSHSGDIAVPRLTTFALGITRPFVLLPLLLVCLVAVAASEARLKDEASRLLVQAVVLLVFVPLLAVALSGFLISFHVPDVIIE